MLVHPCSDATMHIKLKRSLRWSGAEPHVREERVPYASIIQTNWLRLSLCLCLCFACALFFMLYYWANQAS